MVKSMTQWIRKRRAMSPKQPAIKRISLKIRLFLNGTMGKMRRSGSEIFKDNLSSVPL
jgi:hypothetical protein